MHGVRLTGDTNPFRNTNTNCCGSNYVPNSHYHHNNNNNQTCNNYLNCAAPKSVLTHNCQLIRQIRSDYPPYPTDVGNYHAQQLYHAPSSIQPPKRLNPLEVNVTDQRQHSASSKVKGPKHPSILKIYKSCPVSPVHEEIDWTTVDRNRSPFGNSSTPNGRDQYEQGPNKRHSMYSDDAKIILEKIHTDTEKLIAEITQKYGDLNVDKHIQKSTNNDDRHTNENEEDGNFSSDSLEDCSLDFGWNGRCQTNPHVKKSVCRKKHRKNDRLPLDGPTRSVSEYFTYDTNWPNPQRNVSLSDILNEDAEKLAQDYAFLNSQRHSSASFFLAPERKSQESLISDDMSGCGVSYCNSMESILSDESECKSAPLEALFMKTKRDTRFYNATCDSTNAQMDVQCTTSKSYGSSPNNGLSSAFDCYMSQNYSDGFQADEYNMDNYDYDSLMNNNSSARASNRCSPLPPPPPEFQNITKSSMIPNSCTFPSLSTLGHSQNRSEDFIPRFGSKNDQYTAHNTKSLSKDFAVKRQMNNSNPLYTCDDEDFFQRKPINVKPAIPAKPTKLLPTPIIIDSNKVVASTSNEPPVAHRTVKKSCSFEIEMFHNRGKALQKSAAKKYEQNLEKFENDRLRNRKTNAQFGGTMEMNYVPHKPPVANRRSASMKSKRSTRFKEPQSNMIPKEKLHQKCHNDSLDDFHDERSIEIYIAEKGVCENDNMDSLELYAKPNLYKENSIDSLDDLLPSKKGKSKSTIDAQIRCQSAQSMIMADFLSRDEYKKFRDIENKIDVINKLVEFEEKKLEQEKIAKEIRMLPFACNSNEKGYVRSLTLNFDNLAKSIQYERKLSQRLKDHGEMRRNHSLPDVLEVAKYRLDCDLRERHQRSTENYLDGYGVEGVGLYYQFEQIYK